MIEDSATFPIRVLELLLSSPISDITEEEAQRLGKDQIPALALASDEAVFARYLDARRRLIRGIPTDRPLKRSRCSSRWLLHTVVEALTAWVVIEERGLLNRGPLLALFCTARRNPGLRSTRR